MNTSKVQNYIDKNKNNAYIQSTLTIIALTIFIAFAIRPTVVNALHTNSDLQKYKDINGQFEDKIESLTEAKEMHSTYSSEIELINKLIPSYPDEGNFINLLNKIASSDNVYIEKISFQHGGKAYENGIKEIGFRISLGGRYEDFFKFTEDLKKTQRLMKINALSINSDNSSEIGTYIKADITGTTYYKVRPKRDIERNNDN